VMTILRARRPKGHNGGEFRSATCPGIFCGTAVSSPGSMGEEEFHTSCVYVCLFSPLVYSALIWLCYEGRLVRMLLRLWDRGTPDKTFVRIHSFSQKKDASPRWLHT
jgi:hypothetical protein